jgi:hypothetical protein
MTEQTHAAIVQGELQRRRDAKANNWVLSLAVGVFVGLPLLLLLTFAISRISWGLAIAFLFCAPLALIVGGLAVDAHDQARSHARHQHPPGSVAVPSSHEPAQLWFGSVANDGVRTWRCWHGHRTEEESAECGAMALACLNTTGRLPN